MADDIDRAQEREQEIRDEALSRLAPYEIPAGVPGECDSCGEWASRLVGGDCVPCRSKAEVKRKATYGRP